MISCGLLFLGAELVDLVEDDDHVRAVLSEFGQVVRVQREVRILLRIDHPEDDIDESDETVGFDPVLNSGRVVVGQVEEDEAVEATLVIAIEC